MGELIPFTPEEETTPERFFWDNVIRSLEALAELAQQHPSIEYDPIDVFATLEALKDEYEEDALMLLFGQMAMITVPPGQTSELDAVWEFLSAAGFIEP